MYTDTILRFNSYFPGEPGLAGTRMSILVFVGAKDDGSDGDNWRSYKTFNAPVSSSPSTNQHPVFIQGVGLLMVMCPSCRPTNSIGALKENIYSNTHK